MHASRPLPALLLLAIACGGDTTGSTPAGTLVVTITTTGQQLDPNGYTLHLDDTGTAAVSINDTLEAEVPPGSYLAVDLDTDLGPTDLPLSLSGVASNCEVVASEAPAIITDGGTESVGFTVSCDSTFGSVTVITTTTGGSPDADGYQIRIDGVARGTVPATGSGTIENLPTGLRIVHLSGLAGNCSGDVTDTLAVAGGANAVANFTIACPTPASITVSVISGGVSIDPDGYQVWIDGVPTAASANDTVGPATVGVGARTVALRGVVMNCAIAGDSTRNVVISAEESHHESFAVTCSAPPVAYAHGASGSGYSIWRMNPDGSNGSAIVPFAVTGGRAPAWSPDHQQLTFSRGTGDVGQALARVNADGTGLTTLFDSVGVTAPRWSPDGSRILFTRHPGGTNDYRFTRTWVIDADGSEPGALITDSLGAFGADWSPTGDRVAIIRYAANGSGAGISELVIVDLADSSVTSIVGDTIGPVAAPRWLPNSETIGFRCLASKFCTIETNGTGLVVRNMPALPSSSFDWSPDGSRVLWAIGNVSGALEFSWATFPAFTWQYVAHPSAHRIEPTW